MTIPATTNYSFPLMTDGTQNDGAVMNGILTKLDKILKEKVFSLLGSATLGMQTADGAQTAYTVPAAKKAIVLAYIFRNPTASLAGGTSFNLGDGANRDSWKTTVDLSAMTAATDSKVVWDDGTKKTIYDAGDTLGIKPVTGSTADANCIVEAWGYEFDA